MNEYKQQWMEYANAIIPKTIKLQNNQVVITWDNPLVNPKGLFRPVAKTVKSIQMGVALASVDGPLPIMDVVGFTVMTYGATSAWFEYFS